jgi:hypothetical protein
MGRDDMESMSKKRLSWLKDVEISDLLTGDLQFIEESCGRDILLTLLENFPKMTLYISTKPIDQAKKRYVRKYYDGKNTKELCRVLDCSERFIYESLAEKGQMQGQEALFEG